MAGIDNLTPWKPGQSGNPNGPKPGYKHISTWIQELLNDEEFETTLISDAGGYVKFKGAPLKAIILTARFKAAQGDDKAREWLAKYGYGSKVQIDLGDPALAILNKYGLVGGKDNDGKTDEPVQDSSSSSA